MNKVSKIILAISIILFVWFTIDILSQTWWNMNIDFNLASNYGSLLGGIFSFLSVVLIYFTLKQQSEIYEISSFENRYFELIKLHRESIDKWKHVSSSKKEKTIEVGQRVFIEIHRQIYLALEELNKFINTSDFDLILNDVGRSKYSNLQLIKERKIDYIELHKLNISYLIVFFGVGTDGKPILKKALQVYYDLTFVNKLISRLEKINPVWDSSKTFKYFGGHQHRLGHYFRHLYQSINYINNYKNFSKEYKTKYEYVKLYRAQFSTYEQSIIFFNSISDIGIVWELNKNTNDLDNMLITKYNLLKNIPSEFINSTDLKKYYPLMRFEGETKHVDRMNLEKKYK